MGLAARDDRAARVPTGHVDHRAHPLGQPGSPVALLPLRTTVRVVVVTRLLLELTVEGEPRAKGRPRFGNGHAFTPRATRDAESAFAWEAKAQGGKPASTPVRVHLDFHTKTRRRVDLDNLTKLVCDALNGVVWVDDSQIVGLVANRHHDPGRPRTVVRVYALRDEGEGVAVDAPC